MRTIRKERNSDCACMLKGRKLLVLGVDGEINGDSSNVFVVFEHK